MTILAPSADERVLRCMAANPNSPNPFPAEAMAGLAAEASVSMDDLLGCLRRLQAAGWVALGRWGWSVEGMSARSGIPRPVYDTDRWRRLRLRVFERDGYACVYCDAVGTAPELRCDHVVALSVGGSSEMDNLVTACGDCNRRKRAMPVERFLAAQPERLSAVMARLGAAGGVA